VHIEFIDSLRCPELHEETWLVAALNRMDGRDVVEAKLGCPICRREFFIQEGVGLFGELAPRAERRADTAAGETAIEIAAFLDLVTPGKVILLAGELASHAEAAAQLSKARVIALNPLSSAASSSPQVATIRAGGRIPLASSSLDGIALDRFHSTESFLAEAARLLRPRGRLVAGAQSSLPREFKELARDQDKVVAEYMGELVSLARPQPM
jgi:hypothetical protein